MRRRTFLGAGLGVLAFGRTGAARSAPVKGELLQSAVDRAVRPLLDEHGAPGVAVAVTEAGRASFFNYGVASKETGASVTPETLFELGSVSKAFTATFIAYAQALGRLSLDDRPSRFVPELRDCAVDRASLIELATYTAGGLPLQFPDAVADEAGMTAFFRNWKPSAAPGAERRYSNPSIGLAGRMAAQALDGDFARLAETELFPRLGLARSHVRVPKSAMDAYAWGYGRDGRPMRVNPGVFDAEAYGIKSTAADMIRFVEANIRPEALDPATRRAVEETHVGRFQVGEMVQGLGWEQFPWPVALERLLAGNSAAMAMEAQPATRLPPKPPSRPTLFGKTGSTNGFGAYVAFVPARRIGIVMLANKSVPIPARITAAHAVLERLSAEAG